MFIFIFISFYFRRPEIFIDLIRATINSTVIVWIIIFSVVIEVSIVRITWIFSRGLIATTHIGIAIRNHDNIGFLTAVFDIRYDKIFDDFIITARCRRSFVSQHLIYLFTDIFPVSTGRTIRKAFSILHIAFSIVRARQFCICVNSIILFPCFLIPFQIPRIIV